MIYLRVQLDGAAVKGKLVKGPYKPIHRNCAIFLSICISTGQWSDSPRLWTFFLDSKPRLSGQLFGKVGGVHLTWNPPKRAGESIKHQSLPNFYSHIIQYIIYMYIFCNILCQKDAIPYHTIIKNEREASLHKAVEEDMIFSRNFREAWINLCGISVGANGSGMFLGLGSHSLIPYFSSLYDGKWSPHQPNNQMATKFPGSVINFGLRMGNWKIVSSHLVSVLSSLAGAGEWHKHFTSTVKTLDKGDVGET